MSSVTFSSSVGGNNSTVSDDADPNTGLANGGHRLRFVPALAQVVQVASFVVAQANAAAVSAASASGAPGTSATTSTSILVGTGSKSFTLNQTGKLFSLGQRVAAASAANALNQISGPITAFNSGTGAMTISADASTGSGTFTDGVVSLSSAGGIPSTRSISAAGLATGGGDFSANRTITVTEALASDIRVGTDKTKVVTIGDVSDALQVVALQFGANITTVGDANLDMSKFIHASVTVTGNFTLPNPISHNVGDSGRIKITQDATGSRLLSAWGSSYKAEGGKPVLSTAAGAIDYLYYDVVSTIEIVCSLVKAPTN